jgi:hypothetical protein
MVHASPESPSVLVGSLVGPYEVEGPSSPWRSSADVVVFLHKVLA